MNRKNFIYLFACLLIGCSNNKKVENDLLLETIIIDEDAVKNVTDASFMIDTSSIEVVALETNDECLIGEMGYIFLKKDKIIIYDRMAHGAYIFNRDGSYHAKVVAVGQGPGEYPSLFNDLVVTENYICVLVAERAIMLYDFDGKYIRDIPMEGNWAITFFTFDEKEYYLVDNWGGFTSKYHLYSLNPQTHKVNSYLPIAERDIKINRGWALEDKPYSLTDERALLLIGSIDTIFSISPTGEVAPQYAVNIVKNAIPDNLKFGDRSVVMQRWLDHRYIMGFKSIVESTRFLYLTEYNNFYIVYDKIEKKVKASAHTFSHPLFGEFSFSYVYPSIDDRDEIGVFFAIDDDWNSKENLLKQNVGSGAFGTAFTNALMKLDDREPNPMVVILRLKK